MTSEPTEQTADPAPKATTWRASLATRLKARLTAGVILIIPIWITIFLVTFVFRLTRDASLWAVNWVLLSRWGEPLLEQWGVDKADLVERGLDALPLGLRWVIGGVAVFITISAIYMLGSITTNLAGRRFIRLGESILGRLPLVKTIYKASKQVLETFASPSAPGFKRVVSIPFPSREVRSIGFVTRSTTHPETGEELCAVFLATTPNPTTGFVFIMRRSELVELDWPIDEAVKVVMSAGVLLDEKSLVRAAPPRLPV